MKSGGGNLWNMVEAIGGKGWRHLKARSGGKLWLGWAVGGDW